LTGDDATRHDLAHVLAQTRSSVDMVSRQLTSLTSDVATLSADVRHIMSLLHTRLLTSSVPGDVISTPTSQSKSAVSGWTSPVVAGILKSSSSPAARPAHRVEFKSSPADQSHLRPSSSSASLAAAVRLDDQLSSTPSRRRRQSVDMTSLRRHVLHGQPSPLTLDHTAYRAPAHVSLTIPSTDL